MKFWDNGDEIKNDNKNFWIRQQKDMPSPKGTSAPMCLQMFTNEPVMHNHYEIKNENDKGNYDTSAVKMKNINLKIYSSKVW